MRNLILLSSFLSLSLFGCVANPDDLVEQGETLNASDDSDGKADSASTIAFTAFSDDVGAAGGTETRKLFTSQLAYVSFFGHKAPASVDFSKEWVVFYAAGVKNTGGYTAAVSSVSKSRTGLTLKVVTALTSPGVGCLVTQSLTHPYVLGKLKQQSSVAYLQFYRDDEVRDCAAAPDGTCASDADCTLSDNYCGGCACEALGPGQTPTTCAHPVNCFAQPCGTQTARCNPVSHRCEARPTAGTPCGSNHCGAGEYCCNASCGMCAKMGMLCIQLACN